MMPLSMMDTGTCCTVAGINGRDKTKKFLENLGFVEGETVTVISEIAGNMIVCVKDTRVAIDRKMACRIMCDR